MYLFCSFNITKLLITGINQSRTHCRRALSLAQGKRPHISLCQNIHRWQMAMGLRRPSGATGYADQRKLDKVTSKNEGQRGNARCRAGTENISTC